MTQHQPTLVDGKEFIQLFVYAKQ